MSTEILDFLKSAQVVFAVAIVFVSALGSIVVALISGRHQQKAKHMEMYFTQRIKTYTEFIEAAADLTLYQLVYKDIPVEFLRNIVIVCMKVKLVSPDNISEKIGELIELSESISVKSDTHEFENVLEDTVKLMRSELCDWKKQGRIK